MRWDETKGDVMRRTQYQARSSISPNDLEPTLLLLFNGNGEFLCVSASVLLALMEQPDNRLAGFAFRSSKYLAKSLSDSCSGFVCVCASFSTNFGFGWISNTLISSLVVGFDCSLADWLTDCLAGFFRLSNETGNEPKRFARSALDTSRP